MKLTIETKDIGKYDVVVCGGGSAGVTAAIAAARQGARVLVTERTFTVGGMLTLGNAGITKFTEHCRDPEKYRREVLNTLAGDDPASVQVAGGIPHEYALRMIRSGVAVGTHGEAGSYVFPDRYAAQWTLLDMLSEAGVEVMYDTRVIGAETESGLDSRPRVSAAALVNKEGFLSVRADCFIDATGDADLAAFAGVEFNKGATEADIAEGCGKTVGELMSFGTMFRVRGVDFPRLFDWLEANPASFHMQEFGIMPLADARAAWEAGQMSVFRIVLPESVGSGYRLMQVYNMPARDEAVFLGPFCGCKGDGLDAKSLSNGQNTLQLGVRRLIAALHELKGTGLENVRATFIPDVGVRETRHIAGEYVLTGLDVMTGRDFEDSIACGGHPIDISPIPSEVEHMDMDHWRFHIPYRILVPKGIDGLLVAGRSVSATRMASGSLRPTVQCMAMGEAAGVAAALSASGNLSPACVDTAELRRILRENGAII